MAANTRDIMGDAEALDALIAGTLTELTDDLVRTVGGYVLYKNSTIVSVSFPNATLLRSDAMRDCDSLKSVDIGGAATIYTTSCYECNNLEAIILRSDTMCTLSQSAWSWFKDSKILSGQGGIYVPSELVDTYKADSRWSALASYIFSIDDYQAT